MEAYLPLWFTREREPQLWLRWANLRCLTGDRPSAEEPCGPISLTNINQPNHGRVYADVPFFCPLLSLAHRDILNSAT
jgi:hypothetical protein